MESLGYPCEDVGLAAVEVQIFDGVNAHNVGGLYVKERDLLAVTDQAVMSQGMFRALSLVIHLNYWMLRKSPRTILVDDIGEGLDFSRAQSFISLLIERAKENNMQLLMTTNDRFVMNGVPLDYWGVIARKQSQVRVITKHNSPKVFSEFEMLGLNNFDFFSTNFFAESQE